MLKKPDIHESLQVGNINNFIITMFSRVSEKCEYGEKIEALSAEEQTLYFVRELEAQVGNGGFNQYFFNAGGNFAYETVDALTVIGAKQTAEILKKAIDAFGCEIPKNWSDRQDLLIEKETDDEFGDILSDCDAEFHEYNEDLNDLNYRYIMKNKEQFDGMP